jgi:opacity protein-like surface antigen
MKSFRKLLLLFLLVASTGIDTFSQSRYNIHIGPAFPLSKIDMYTLHYSDVYTVSSSAKTGINIGIQYSYQFPNRGIGIFAGLDFVYNDVINEYKDSVESIRGVFGYESFEFPKYYNIPISAGLEYIYEINEKLSLLCNLGMTYNFFKVTDYTYNNMFGDYAHIADWANSFGFKTAIGILYKQKASISIDFLGLGEHEVDVKTLHSGTVEDEFIAEAKVNMLTLTIGWNF